MPKAELQNELAREWQELLASLPPERTTAPRWLFLEHRIHRPGPAALFAELEEVRLAWEGLHASPALEKYAERFINPGWTLKDLLAHLASWASEFRRQVETVARGEAFDYAIPYALSALGPAQWNQVEVDKRSAASLAALREEFQAENRRLQDLVLKLPGETLQADAVFPLAPSGDPAALWKGNIAQIVTMKCLHDRYHIGQLQEWLERQQTGEHS